MRQPTAAPSCTSALAPNFVILAAAFASETLLRSVLEGVREDWSIALCDFAVRRMEAQAQLRFSLQVIARIGGVGADGVFGLAIGLDRA